MLKFVEIDMKNKGCVFLKKSISYKIMVCLLTIVLLLTFGGCANKNIKENSLLTLTESQEIPSEETLPEEIESEEVPPEAVTPTPAEKLLSEMSLEDKVAQLFIVDPELLEENGKTTSYSGNPLKYNVGGVILFAKNIETREQCSTLIKSLQNASKLPLFVSVDEEGGKVARLGNNPDMETTKFPNMADIKTQDEAYNVGKVIGSEIKELGFNLDFAPVADVNSNPHNPIIGVRSFGSDPQHVATQVAAAVNGFHSSGMLCTLKHFPGHGDTKTDSHLGYTQEDKTLEQLYQTEFVPFKAGISAGADFVMVGHISVPEVTGNDLPATLSPKMIGILRNELNFDGLIITDALKMGAISDRFTSGEAAVMSLQAGTDVLLRPEDLDSAIRGVVDAVKNGTLTEERINQSVLRILEKKIASGIIS